MLRCLAQINLQKLWVTLGSMLVSLTFVFGNNMRQIYEAVVFLFVVHPYDVGDTVLVGPNQDWCKVSVSHCVMAWDMCTYRCISMSMYVSDGSSIQPGIGWNRCNSSPSSPKCANTSNANLLGTHNCEPAKLRTPSWQGKTLKNMQISQKAQ